MYLLNKVILSFVHVFFRLVPIAFPDFESVGRSVGLTKKCPGKKKKIIKIKKSGGAWNKEGRCPAITWPIWKSRTREEDLS